MRFATVNGLPGVIVDAPEGPVQTAAFEIDGDVIRALYVVRNPDKLRHLATAAPLTETFDAATENTPRARADRRPSSTFAAQITSTRAIIVWSSCSRL